MELIVVIIMIGIGVTIALAIGVSVAAAQHEGRTAGGESNVSIDRHHLAASILFNLLLAGGAQPDEALRDVRRQAGLGAPVTASIDISSWGGRFASIASPEQRAWLLETAVQLLAARSLPVPLRQYTALLDLSFALGFQTDALARLRQQYGFQYVDHAKDARPRSADRSGGATALFVRSQTDRAALLRVLGLNAGASRAAIVAAYRRLAAQHHPDRVFGEPAEIQSAAAARFIEITRAYEALLSSEEEAAATD